MSYQQKTLPESQPVTTLIERLPTPRRQQEARVLVALFETVTGERATMWGASIIGFGQYHYQYASGHKGTAARVGFSPRKAALSLYLLLEEGTLDGVLSRLGKHRAAKGCLYVNKLDDIDLDVLQEAIRISWERMAVLYPL